MQQSIPNIWGPQQPRLAPKRKEVKEEPQVDLSAIRELLLNPSAIRGYGTGLGAAAGSLAGQPVLGGIAGSAATNFLQTLIPQYLGQPSQEPIKTSIVDSLANLVGGKVAGGIMALGGPLKVLGQKALGLGDDSIVANVASKFATKPAERFVINPLNPTYNTTLEPSIQSLVKEGAPLSLGEVTGGLGSQEFGKLADGAAARIPQQNVWLSREAKKLLAPQTGVVQQEQLLREGKDRMASWVVQTSPGMASHKDPINFVKGATSNLKSFLELTGRAGPEKAHTVLFKDALESAMTPDGAWDGAKLFKYFQSHRDLFNTNARLLEQSGIAKASDLKASWNRFIHANTLMRSGRSGSDRGMEMALTNAGISAAIGIPILGPFSYPAWRAIAGAGRILLVGPSLGKAFNNPEVVEQFVKLTTNAAKSPSNVATIRKLASWAWKNGVSFKSAEGTDFMINPSDMSKPYPVEQTEETPEVVIPQGLWSQPGK